MPGAWPATCLALEFSSKMSKLQRRQGLSLADRSSPSYPGKGLHVLDDVIAELGALDFGGSFHLAGEIVGDPFGGDGSI